MTTEQNVFFELVRAGLWGTAADAAAFDLQTDWKQLYHYGKSQTLLGVMLDGIQSLPAELRPPRGLYLPWCASVAQMEEGNRKLNHEIGNLYALLRAHGVEPVLLKGQGVARNYRTPLHRQSGDIDIYVSKRQFKLVNRLLRQEGREPHEANVQHCSFDWHGVVVENHRILAQMAHPGLNRRLQRNIASWHTTGKTVRFDLEGCEVTVPPLEFDAIYLLEHAMWHLFSMGIGLRQICDWARLLHHNREQLDREAVVRELTALRLDRTARIFGALAVKYLGMPEADLLLPFDRDDEACCDWLLDDIWNSGNFGRADTSRKLAPKGYWRHKWNSFKLMIRRNRKLREIAPSEARWKPVVAVTNLIWAQYYKYIGRHFA